jgi:hypothetical protein
VLAAASCDVGVVAYEMTVLVSRTGDVLTPACGPSSRPPSRDEHPEAGKDRCCERLGSRARQALPARQVRRRHDGAPTLGQHRNRDGSGRMR